MYNLFVNANFGYWEQNSYYELEVARAYEYLDAGIENEYRTNLVKRKDLPCLFFV